MHHLHTLVWFYEQLAQGNRIAWIAFTGTVIALVIAFVRDFRTSIKSPDGYD